MLYKHYSIHSNEVLNKYFYYNSKDFVWMCRLTDTPACENAVLENEHDLDFRGLLSDKVVYLRGHWVPLEHASGVSEEERALVELACDPMLLHSTLEYEWLLSTTAVDDGTKRCRDRHAVEKHALALKTLTLSSSRPAESHGERMLVLPISGQPVTEEQAVEGKLRSDETDADASVAASHEDNDRRCHESETVKRTNMFVVEELPEDPEEVDGGQEDTNADAFVDSTYRDKESDCSGGYEADTEDGDDDGCHPGPLSEEPNKDTLIRSDCSDEKSNCHKEKENDESCHSEQTETLAKGRAGRKIWVMKEESSADTLDSSNRSEEGKES
jgi:hypothetical protein